MRPRIIAGCAVLMLAAALAGCTVPAPTLTPTPTGFADDAAAFAAAEATYRAYVDAQNQVDLRDPATAEPMFALTVGDLNADDRTGISRLHADRWTKEGTTLLKWFAPESFDSLTATTKAIACVDVSSIRLLDEAGDIQGEPERQAVYALEVDIVGSTSPRISRSIAVGDARCD